jgi:hypothetical protein
MPERKALQTSLANHAAMRARRPSVGIADYHLQHPRRFRTGEPGPRFARVRRGPRCFLPFRSGRSGPELRAPMKRLLVRHSRRWLPGENALILAKRAKRRSSRGEGARVLSVTEFPGNREKDREISPFSAIFGKTVSKSPTIRGRSSKIPYAVEQGIFSPSRESKFPAPPKAGIFRA